jgi:hypothetical protein
MWDGLRRVDENHCPSAMCPLTDFLRRIDRTKDIRNVRKRHDLCSLRKKRVQLVEPQMSVVAHIPDAERRSRATRRQLPGN